MNMDDSVSVRLRVNQALAAVILLLAIWLSSGTLAPYGATLSDPLVIEPCHYLANIDHPQFLASYALFDRQPSSEWAHSVVLRRVLYPLLAFPFMKLITVLADDQTVGFFFGGLLTTMLLHVGTLIVFTRFVSRRYGDRAGIAACWLLASYPGITYWAGLPYSYAAIVPFSLLALMLLFRIDEAGSEKELAVWSFILGILFTGYDLVPFFGAASFLLVLKRKSIRASSLNAICFLLPMVLVTLLLRLLPQLPATNSNTAAYGTIVAAYFRPSFPEWGELLAKLPQVTLLTFLYSNFVILPLAWLFSFTAPRGWKSHRVEIALVLAVAAVFLFNNAAPPYPGWQLRGDWIARLYQPLFVVFILGLSRWIAAPSSTVRLRFAVVLIFITVLLNASIAFGPMIGNPMAFRMYERFYRHDRAGVFANNLERFGRRPLGICEPGHPRGEGTEPATFERPRYMFVPYPRPE